MEEEQEVAEVSTPYKSNYSLGITFTILTLVAVAGYILSMFFPAASCISSLGSIISFILLMVWFHRSYTNLASYNNMGLKYSAGWAVGSFFVPLLNLFRPYQIAQEIWTASDPEASTVGWKQSKISIVIIFWWISLLSHTGITLGTTGYSIWLGIQSAMSGVQPDVAQVSAIGIPVLVGYAVYCILTISVVTLINDRQDEKAEKLDLL
jgi:hypothetical protein